MMRTVRMIGTLLGVLGLVSLPAQAMSTSTEGAGTSTEDSLASQQDHAGATPLAAHLATLTADQRETFVETRLLATETVEVSSQVPTDATALRSARDAAVAGEALDPLASGCWTARGNGEGKALAGNTLFTYYTVGGWCSSGSKITDAWLADAGGETSTIGWRYEGVINKSSGIVSNQGRAYAQFKFVLGSGGIDVQSPTPCLRIKGTSAPAATVDTVCGIY
jgi:hypothetical protein